MFEHTFATCTFGKIACAGEHRVLMTQFRESAKQRKELARAQELVGARRKVVKMEAGATIQCSRPLPRPVRAPC